MTGRILEFDSEWFGMKVGRCDGDPWQAHLWAVDQHVDFLYTLLPLADISLFDPRLVDFRVVDVRVEMALDLTEWTDPEPDHVEIAKQWEIDWCIDLARTAFKGSRFFNDRSLPRDRVEDMYANWLLHSDPVLVSYDPNVDGPAGFATLEEDTLGLIAVHPDTRGRGVGGRLLDMVAYSNPGNILKAVTQGGNTAAQRLFQSRGFRTTATGLWLHKDYR